MAATSRDVVRKTSEQSPLLRGEPREGLPDGDGSEELLGGREEVLVTGKANQQVGRGRGFLITISLWAMIFLQGSFYSNLCRKVKNKI